jgi:hypothetical protein
MMIAHSWKKSSNYGTVESINILKEVNILVVNWKIQNEGKHILEKYAICKNPCVTGLFLRVVLICIDFKHWSPGALQ